MVSPETPVSISSKINVGNLEYCAIAFTASIIRTSPHQKPLFNIPKSVPLFAANKIEFHLYQCCNTFLIVLLEYQNEH
jgi:hypothetical protein